MYYLLKIKKWAAIRNLLKPMLALAILLTLSHFVAAQNNGTFIQEFTLVKANVQRDYNLQILGTYSNGATVDISTFANESISLINFVGNGGFHAINFTFLNVTEYVTEYPWSLRGNIGNNFTAVPELKIPGTKTVIARGMNTRSQVYQTLNLTFTIINKIAPVPVPMTVPVPAPAMVPVRVNIPIPVPVSIPVPRSMPVTVPIPVPVPVKVPVPVIAPVPVTIQVPVTIPMTVPMSVPMSVTVPMPVTAPLAVPVPILAPMAFPNATVRINAGSTVDWIDPSGNVWSADNFFNSGSNITSSSREIGNTELDTLFFTDRVFIAPPGSIGRYNIPVYPGVYNVTVMFAEVYFWSNNQRTFDLSIQNSSVVASLDIIRLSGQNNAYSVTFTATVASSSSGPMGVIVIAFKNVIENAKVNAIEIKYIGIPSPTAPIPAPVSAPALQILL